VALQLCGIGPGDEVITPSQTFFAAPNMIAKVGATPVFVDVELISRNLDFDAVERAITPRTKAIMPTHFAGLPVAMDRLYEIAGRHRLAGDRGCGAGHRIELARGGSAVSAI
jgi:dTDP-4-amino-4,6-dideoxygalactose transaminase